MYNGIGLATARGSGTNGYVQRNWASIKKVKEQTFKTEEELAKIDSSANRQPNQELLDHDRKRKVELKCIELEQSLEDQGYSQDEINDKINSFRISLLGKQKSGTEYDECGRPIPANAVMTAKTKSIQQVNINLKKKRSRRRKKKNKNKNICECCMDGMNITNSLSTLNTKGTLFLHHMPWGCLNTVCLNGMQFANMNSLKSFLSVKDTHQFADEQLKKNARLRDAFGISEFFIEGSSLDPERKTKEAALAQLKTLQVDQAAAQTQMNDDTSTNKDSSITNELQFKSPKHKKRKKKKSKSHKVDREKGSDKKKSKKHKKRHSSSSDESLRNDEVKFNKISQVKSKCDDDKSDRVVIEKKKKKYESDNHKKYSRDNDKKYKNDKKEVENKYKSDRDNYRKKDSKFDNSKSSKKDKSSEEIHRPKSKDNHESKKLENSPRHKTPVKDREKDRERDYDKFSYRHQKQCDDSKSNKEKYDKKSDKGDTKYSSKRKNQSPIKGIKKSVFKPGKLTCITDDSDSNESCYTPPPKDMNAVYSKFSQSKLNEDKNAKNTKYTFSLREESEDRLVVTKANGRTNDLKISSQNNSELQNKKIDSRKLNNRVDKIFLDSSSSEEGGLEEDIDLNIIKEITTEKIKKVFELHEKQEQALLHLKKKLMEKKRKVRSSSSSSVSSDEPVKKKSLKRRNARDSSSSNSDGNTRKKSKRSRSSSSTSNASDTSVDRHKSSSKRRSSDKYSKKKSPVSRRRTKDSLSRSRSISISSTERSRKKRVSSSEESSPRRKRKSSKRKRSSRRRRRSDSSSSSSVSSPCYKKKSRYSSSRSRSTSRSSSSRYSRSSSSSHGSSSSVSSRSSKSRSASIPRRRGSPSFLDRRRITSARKRPIPYTRLTPFSTNSDTDSVISVLDSPFAEIH